MCDTARVIPIMRFSSTRSLRGLCAAGVLAFSCAASHAGSIPYGMTGVSTSAGPLTGWATMGTAADRVTAADIAFNDSANIGTGDLAICLASGACGTESSQTSYVQAYVSNGKDGPFNIISRPPNPEAGHAETPEPASLFLLGTGIVLFALLIAKVSERRQRSAWEPDPVE